MRRVVLLALSCALLGAAGGKPLPQAKPPAPIEDRRYIDDGFTDEQIQALVWGVRLKGWRCDSVSSLLPMTFEHGYMLKCNDRRFDYAIIEPGGRFTIEAR